MVYTYCCYADCWAKAEVNSKYVSTRDELLFNLNGHVSRTAYVCVCVYVCSSSPGDGCVLS